jgi:hypothetical protein
MPIRYPIEYDLNPTSVEPGWRWLILTLRNIGSESLTGLDVQLNSLDSYNLRAMGTGAYIAELGPNQERVHPFQVAANLTANVYVSVDGLQDSELFHWESPTTLIGVGKDLAELAGLFAMSEPYPPVGQKVRCEATVRGLTESPGLRLEFWVDTPAGEFDAIGEVETKRLGAGEEATYAAEFMPDEEGLYTVYAYLFDGIRRIGRRTEHVLVRES